MYTNKLRERKNMKCPGDEIFNKINRNQTEENGWLALRSCPQSLLSWLTIRVKKLNSQIQEGETHLWNSPGTHLHLIQMLVGTNVLRTGLTSHCWTRRVHCCHSCSTVLEHKVGKGNGLMEIQEFPPFWFKVDVRISVHEWRQSQIESTLAELNGHFTSN